MKLKVFSCGIMLLAVCTMLMVGCKKDEPETQQQQQQEETQTTAKPAVASVFYYTFSVTDSMRLVADFTISYYDQDGKLQTEKLEANNWEKTIKAGLPAKLGVHVDAALKADFDASKYTKVYRKKSYTASAYCLDEDGKKVGKVGSHTLNTGNYIPAEKMSKYFNDEFFLKSLYKYEADGTITELSEWE